MQRRHFNLNSVDDVSVRRAIYGQEREKVRQEAITARERIPPHYRAEAYPEKTPEHDDKEILSVPDRKGQPSPSTVAGSKMSDRFNRAAFDPDPAHEHKPVTSNPELKRNPPPEEPGGGDFRI